VAEDIEFPTQRPYVTLVGMIDYSAQLQVWFDDPRRVGELVPGPLVGRGVAGSAAEGMCVHIDLCRDRERIVDAAFQAFGCAATIACASWVTNWSVGKPAADAVLINHGTIAAALDLPRIKVSSAVLAEQALKLAVDKTFQQVT